MWGEIAAVALEVGGAILGSDSEKKAAKKAAEQQRELEGKAEGVRRNLYTNADKLEEKVGVESKGVLDRVTDAGQKVYDDSESVRGVRDTAASQLQDALSGKFENTPGYEFIRSEALQATARSEAAQGRNVSGNKMIALQDRAASVASTEYNNILQSLNGLLGTSGQLAAGASSTYSNMVSNANNMYSSLFSFGAGTSETMRTAGETGYLDTARGVSDSISGIELYKGQVGSNLANNIAGTVGSTVTDIWGKDKTKTAGETP